MPVLYYTAGNVGGSFHVYSLRIRGVRSLRCADHRSLRWLQNSDGMLARWYMLLGQFSDLFEYRPGAQHANADGLSHQCGRIVRCHCQKGMPVTPDVGSTFCLFGYG